MQHVAFDHADYSAKPNLVHTGSLVPPNARSLVAMLSEAQVDELVRTIATDATDAASDAASDEAVEEANGEGESAGDAEGEGEADEGEGGDMVELSVPSLRGGQVLLRIPSALLAIENKLSHHM